MSSAAAEDAPFVVAARGGTPSRRPVWIKRQAGRYLPEYRAMRERYSFVELCANADAATEVTLQPLERFDLDASIIFTDLLTPVAAMGIDVDFNPGPVLTRTIKTLADVESLQLFDPTSALAPMLSTARQVRAALPSEKAVLGFVGAPFTLACYLIEGKGSKDWSQARRMMHAEPELFGALLDRIVAALKPLIGALADAGCDGIQVFDSWAGVLSTETYAKVCAPRTEQLLDAARGTGKIAINFVNGVAQHLDTMSASKADMLAVDWRLPMRVIREQLPNHALQGNLDPTALFLPEAQLRRAVADVCEGAGSGSHVFNLGHGILPQVDPQAVAVVVDEVHRQ